MIGDVNKIYQDDEHWYFIAVDSKDNYYLITYSGGFAMETVAIQLDGEQISDFKKDENSLLGLAQDLAKFPENYNLIEEIK